MTVQETEEEEGTMLVGCPTSRRARKGSQNEA